MFAYYDPTGKIICSIEAKSNNFIPPNNPGTSIYLDDIQYAQLYNNGSPDLANWTIDNNVPVYTPVASSVLLQAAQQRQIGIINARLNTTLLGGFTSKTTTHTYVTTTNGQANMEGDLKRFELDSALTSVQFYTVDKGWLAHSHQDLINAFLDGGKWKDAQYAQAQTLISQINAATTIAAVQAIVWAEASY